VWKTTRRNYCSSFGKKKRFENSYAGGEPRQMGSRGHWTRQGEKIFIITLRKEEGAGNLDFLGSLLTRIKRGEIYKSHRSPLKEGEEE